MTKPDSTPLFNELQAALGMSGPPMTARDPVNLPMIRHWCDAMSDHNPSYVDTEFAAKSVHGQVVAPPAMLMAWTMAGLRPAPMPAAADRDSGSPHPYELLDRAGFTSVVATDTEHAYLRYLRLGDLLTASGSVTEVSPEKKTALGVGHFVTTETEYRNQDDELVGRMLFRILKFKPGTGRMAAPADASTPASAQRPKRPRPSTSRDTQFFWDGIDQGELRIQECRDCSSLQHPPMVRCPRCGNYDLGHRVASGRGTLYSFVEPVYPQVPAFDYPLVVGLVELEEGTRLLTNIIDVDPAAVEIGMPVELVCKSINSDRDLPLFRPASPARREETLRFEEVAVGQNLAPCAIPITPTLIVAGAIASRDYQDVHHDRDLAIKRGSPDIFMNILTTSGLVGRYLTDWAGPEARLKKLKIRLGAPNYPGDTMLMTGQVSRVEDEGSSSIVEVSMRGCNKLGDHVIATSELELPVANNRGLAS